MAGIPVRDHAKRALTEELDVLRSEVPTDRGGFGSIVTLRYTDGTTEVLRIGTVVEDDDGTVVTPDSPLGRALLGQSPGQDITWSTPSAHHQAQILEIS